MLERQDQTGHPPQSMTPSAELATAWRRGSPNAKQRFRECAKPGCRGRHVGGPYANSCYRAGDIYSEWGLLPSRHMTQPVETQT